MANFLTFEGPDHKSIFSINMTHVNKMAMARPHVCPVRGNRNVVRLYYPSGGYDDVFGTVEAIVDRLGELKP